MRERTFELTKTVSACIECPHCSCPVWEHDDPFTSTPMPGGHYCKAANKQPIPEPKQIAGFCPVIAAQRREVG